MRKTLLHYVLVAVVACAWAGAAYAGSENERIAATLAEKNYCAVDADCASIAACPFGCQLPLNKDEVKKAQEIIDGYKSPCAYRCMAPSPLVCRDKKCEVNREK